MRRGDHSLMTKHDEHCHSFARPHHWQVVLAARQCAAHCRPVRCYAAAPSSVPVLYHHSHIARPHSHIDWISIWTTMLWGYCRLLYFHSQDRHPLPCPMVLHGLENDMCCSARAIASKRVLQCPRYLTNSKSTDDGRTVLVERRD